MCCPLWRRLFIHYLVVRIRITLRAEKTCKDRNEILFHNSRAPELIHEGGIIIACEVKACIIYELGEETLIYYDPEARRTNMMVKTRRWVLARVLKLCNGGGGMVRPL